MGAYLEAMRGEDGHSRDAKGKARFNKTQGKRGRDDGEEMEVEEKVGPSGGAAGGRREKKARKEVVKIGAEFKAKVRFSYPHSLRVLRTSQFVFG